jgi:hypothetical protein
MWLTKQYLPIPDNFGEENVGNFLEEAPQWSSMDKVKNMETSPIPGMDSLGQIVSERVGYSHCPTGEWG